MLSWVYAPAKMLGLCESTVKSWLKPAGMSIQGAPVRQQ